MNLQLKRFLLYYLPLAANIGLIAYLSWQLNLIPYFQRQGEFAIFSVIYAVGGAVVAVSGIAAFVHVVADQQGPRRWLTLALVNTIIPTVLLLVLLKFR